MIPNKVDLPPEHVFQKEDDHNCGPCCLAMVYRLRGENCSLDQILKDLNLGEKGETTYHPQLALHLMKRGFKTKLLMSNSQALSPAWANWRRARIIAVLAEWVSLKMGRSAHWNKFGSYLLSYLKEGGEVELKSYSIDDLKSLLDNGSTLIVCVDEVWVWGHRFLKNEAKIDEIRGKTQGHFIVVTGYEGNKFKVLDPYPTNLKGRNGYYMVDAQQLFNACLIWTATVLEIMK